jgi:hypothetical protein
VIHAWRTPGMNPQITPITQTRIKKREAVSIDIAYWPSASLCAVFAFAQRVNQTSNRPSPSLHPGLRDQSRQLTQKWLGREQITRKNCLPSKVNPSMLKKYQILLVVPFALLGPALLYRLDPPPSRIVQPSNETVREVSPTSLKTFTDADFARHVEQLKKKLPSMGFTVIIQRPFVVIGDESPAAVKEHSDGTVKWAVDKLKQDFFTQDPKEILDIWLFQDAASYEKNALTLFGEKPTTPYGYYSSAHKALVMNISTGGGTLVHEIVHPFIESNFPSCPPWFNEGLGSLYEQSGEVNGHIHGYTNWRLPGLQAAIKARKVPSFKTLTGLDENGFYNDDKGTNYGQARYLCYYLQQKGLLIKFYREFYAHRKEDPTGYQTLQKVLRIADMNAFKRRWENYVLGLRQGYDVTVDTAVER